MKKIAPMKGCLKKGGGGGTKKSALLSFFFFFFCFVFPPPIVAKYLLSGIRSQPTNTGIDIILKKKEDGGIKQLNGGQTINILKKHPFILKKMCRRSKRQMKKIKQLPFNVNTWSSP
eukprot:TRINITY_DN2033_c2_g2_i1.p1 TRINITY_DN2033_c2_g2~~TRINITY_DN2033_c2_g2_i1.p1  ORF type:complete len:117 (-),score=8.37 TRINITY_DN2033_c2_g2_i1:86-436(-)